MLLVHVEIENITFEGRRRAAATLKFQAQRRKFISSAASETERERPWEVIFYDETAVDLKVGSLGI